MGSASASPGVEEAIRVRSSNSGNSSVGILEFESLDFFSSVIHLAEVFRSLDYRSFRNLMGTGKVLGFIRFSDFS